MEFQTIIKNIEEKIIKEVADDNIVYDINNKNGLTSIFHGDERNPDIKYFMLRKFDKIDIIIEQIKDLLLDEKIIFVKKEKDFSDGKYIQITLADNSNNRILNFLNETTLSGGNIYPYGHLFLKNGVSDLNINGYSINTKVLLDIVDNAKLNKLIELIRENF